MSIRPLTFAVLAFALFAGGCDRQSAGSAQPSPDTQTDADKPAGALDRSNAGEAIPEFTVSDAEGRTLKLGSLKGKPVLINLWATWCAPCVVELPMLDELAAQRGDSLRVLTISQDTQDTGKVAPFLTEKGGRNLEPWLDPKSDLTFELGAQTLPTTILYDSSGKEVWRYIGGNDWTGEAAAALIEEAT